MPQILVRCKNCQKVFPSGIELGVGATATFEGNITNCRFCGSIENIPNGTFQGTIDGITQILEHSKDKLRTASELLEILEKNKNDKDLSEIRNNSKLSKVKKWLPDSPEKLMVYIAILQIIIQLLTKSPSTQINQMTVVNIYNQVTIQTK